jgi:hypothetical protein
MLRERLISRSPGAPHEFQWRSREVSRLERLSDTVFGFAITLLGFSGVVLGATRGGRYEDLAGYAFGAAEVVAVLILVRFRATRRGRRSVVLNTMSSLTSTGNTTVHAG